MSTTEEIAPESRLSRFFGGVHHPWRRLLARQLDLIVIGVPAALGLMVLAELLYPPVTEFWSSRLADFMFGIMLYCAFIPIEAALLSTAGATPGKWLFGVTVRDQNGSKLTYGAAFKRTSLVFVVGEGFFAVELVTLITRFVAYRRLTTTGLTEWDKAAKSTVTHSNWTPLRLTLSILFYLGLFIGGMYAGIAEVE